MYVHCNVCDHEWQCTGPDNIKCDWCGGSSYILENDPHINFIDGINGVLLKLEKMNNPYADKILKKLKKKKNK